jgi:hypothetical protein
MNNNNNVTKRLSYDTPNYKNKKSYQDSLSPDDIKEKLEEYRQVDNINDITINTHLRYFTVDLKTGEKHFRLGGFLTKIDKEYVILSNGKLRWSVQIKNSIFFEKMSFADLKKELTNTIRLKYENEIQTLIDENKKLKNTLKEVKKEVKKRT